MSDVRVDSETVPVTALREHPANPRRGDVDTIAESLRAHGQYRPIVAQRSTGYILAGNHTWKAARKLGWDRIAVTWLDVDDATAGQVLVADNRTSDLASYDDARLADLLRSLPDLDGTGFDVYDLEKLEGVFDRPFTASEPTGPEPGASRSDTPQVRIGPLHLRVDHDVFPAWSDAFAADRKKNAIVTDLRARLNMPIPPAAPPPSSPAQPTQGVETVAVDSLHPYPSNARQGDVGAISESLRVLGQYRPVVANRADRTILVGNHTWQAARMLGWDQIAVCWVDVDEVQAARIVAVDNRTSDLATYDDDLLGSLLVSLPSIDGTGYTSADLDDLLNGAANGTPHRRPAPTSKVPCIVGKWGWKVPRDQWSAWEHQNAARFDDGTIHQFIADALGLPDSHWQPEEA